MILRSKTKKNVKGKSDNFKIQLQCTITHFFKNEDDTFFKNVIYIGVLFCNRTLRDTRQRWLDLAPLILYTVIKAFSGVVLLPVILGIITSNDW